MDDTTLDEFYADQDFTFEEMFVIVKGKKAHGIPLTTAKEEMMDNFIREWADAFGSDSI